ncbi:histidine kinase [Opitutaceae bacterium TAV5]|nr:histidine kinase [Opitutaceae bacterium TAV5]
MNFFPQIRNRFLLAWLLIAPALSLPASAVLAEPPTAAVADTPVPLAPVLSFLRDPGGRATLDDIRSGSPASGWQPARGGIPNFGYTADAIWLRFRVSYPENGDRVSRRWLVELESTRFDEIDWFLLENGHLVRSESAGHLRPPVRGGGHAGRQPRYPVLMLDELEPGRTFEVYLRLRTEMTFFTPLTLWPQAAWTPVVERRAWRGALFFGYVAGLSVLGIIMAGLTRNRGFLLCYSLLLASIGALLFCVNGYYSWLGWPGAVFWSRHGVLLWHGLALLGLVLFVRLIFEVPRHLPRLDRWWRGMAMATAAWMVLAPFGPYRMQIVAVQGVEAIACLAGVITGICFICRGVKSALWILAGCIGLCIWHPLLYLKFLGVLPMTVSMEQVMQVSAALAGLFFFGAMADRLRQIRYEGQIAARKENELREEMTRKLEQEVRERTEELRQAKERAEEANRFKTLFLANVSHEIRAPLSTLVGLSQAMWMQSGQMNLPTEFSRFLNQIRTGGQYLNLMLTNMLDISAAEAGRIPLHRTKLVLDEWLDSMRNLLEPIATNHDIRVRWDIGSDEDDILGIMETDSVRLTQILLNIAHNAIKFTPRGGAVAISVTRLENVLRLMVSDEGPGIPEVERESVFSAFRQSEAQALVRNDGVGLGLYVVQLNVGLLGGRIGIFDNVPCGARIVVTLPGAAS